MALSSTIYTITAPDVGKTTFDLVFEGATLNPPGYLAKAHIFMWLNDVQVTVGGGASEYGGSGITFTFPTTTTVEVTGHAAVLADKIEFRRTIPKNTPVVDFVDRAGITETQLDTMSLANLYAVHEVLDGYGTGIADILEDTAGYAADAAASEVAAALSETNAAASETAAGLSETAAAASETAAGLSETAAAASEAAAALSETAAETAETNAETAETGALAAQTAAETAQTAAELAETNAAASETAAALSETAAETAETNAETAETNAAASAAAALVSENAADTSATEAAASAATVGGENLIINGDCNIWQRGTSAFINGYQSIDRFRTTYSGSVTTSIYRKTFTVGQTDVPGNPNYYIELNSAGTSGTDSQFYMDYRSEDLKPLSGEQLTLSFYAKGAYTAEDMSVMPYQNFGSGGSTSVTDFGITKFTSMPATWAKYSMTFTPPSISGKTIGTSPYLGLRFYATAGSDYDALTDTLGLTPTNLHIAMIKLELGDTATELVRKSIGAELQDCSRFYQVINCSQYFTAAGVNHVIWHSYNYPVRMRVTPTATESGGTESNVASSTIVGTNTRYFRYEQLSTAAGGSYIADRTIKLDAEL